MSLILPKNRYMIAVNVVAIPAFTWFLKMILKRTNSRPKPDPMNSNDFSKSDIESKPANWLKIFARKKKGNTRIWRGTLLRKLVIFPGNGIIV